LHGNLIIGEIRMHAAVCVSKIVAYWWGWVKMRNAPHPNFVCYYIETKLRAETPQGFEKRVSGVGGETKNARDQVSELPD
jgi:hypothetical protein